MKKALLIFISLYFLFQVILFITPIHEPFWFILLVSGILGLISGNLAARIEENQRNK